MSTSKYDNNDQGDTHHTPRSRQLTEKGHEYQVELKQKNLDNSIRICHKTVKTLEVLLLEPTSAEQLRCMQRTLVAEMEEIEACVQALKVLDVHESEALTNAVQLRERRDFLLYQTRVKIQELETEKKTSESVRSSKHSSRRSETSLKAQAAAEAAELQSKMENFDKLQSLRSQLERAEMQGRLSAAKARLQAIEACSNHSCLSSQGDVNSIPPELQVQVSSEEKVRQFIDSLDDGSHNVGSQDISSAAADSMSTPLDTSRLQQPAQSTTQHSVLIDLADRMLNSHIKVPEPPVFTGDPLMYPAWKSAFTALIEGKNIPESDKIHHLKRYVGGEAKECIDGNFLFSTVDSFNEAKRVLEERYGNSFALEDAFRSKLNNWPKIPSRDGKALRKFADFLNQCLMASNFIPSLSVLSDCHENMNMQRKLPDFMIAKWARKVTFYQQNHQRFPEFSVFVKFVKCEADIACNPVIVNTREAKHNSIKSTVLASTAEESKPTIKRPCNLCNGSHHLNDCKEFLKKSLDDRLKHVLKERLCYACLGIKHQAKVCRYKRKCTICKKLHPTALHRDAKESSTDAEKPQKREKKSEEQHSTSERSKAGCYAGVSESSGTSMIVPVYVSHTRDSSKERLVYALLDDQSDTTFVTEATCNQLGVSGPRVNLKLSTMSASDQVISTQKISNLHVRGFDSETRTALPVAYTREEVPVERSHIPTPETARKWPHLEHIADKLVSLQEVRVGLLIGYNCIKLLAPREVIPPVGDGPYAQRTDLGWGVIGCAQNYKQLSICHRISTRSAVVGTKQAKEVFEQADVSCEKVMANYEKYSHDDITFVRKLTSQIKKEPDGHYVMPLPLKPDNNVILPHNKGQVLSRLLSLKKSLLKNEKYKTDYCEFMREIIDKGYAEKVEDDSGSNVWYIPHHGVYNPNKPKIRIVFDCSCKCASICLNDLLLSGPDLTNKLVGVLCRFRREPIAITCDIEKMFYQFRVAKEDRDMLRFLWWENGDLSREPSVYRMTVHLFGATSSPGCSNFGLKQAAEDGRDPFGEEAANFVSDDFYVDDGLTSMSTVEEAITLIANTIALCQSAGLHLHKFVSNSPEVLKSVPKEVRASRLQSSELMLDTNASERTLGLQWKIDSDTFHFKALLKEKPATKRGILSTVSQIYDPLGFLAPMILVGKQILKEICQRGFDWDDLLTDDIVQGWEKWKAELLLLPYIEIQRCVKPNDFGNVKTVELHNFSDASTKGYGQCSYLRITNEADDVHCCLLFAKSKVVPMKMTTIPRLELCAAVLSVSVSKFLKSELKYQDIKEYFYSDSKVVLGYISNNSKRFHVYVANRVQQIRDYTDPEQWFHVDSESNPADIASRGVPVQQLQECDYWFKGPEQLWRTNEIGFESAVTVADTLYSDPEVKSCFKTTTKTRFDMLEIVNRLSSWHKAKVVVGYCLRYVNNLKCKIQHTEANCSKILTTEELSNAETSILKLVQRSHFAEEINCIENATEPLRKKSALYKFNPFLDKRGLLRLGGRLRNAALTYEEKHPVILPKKDHVTQLLIKHYHEAVYHQGRGITMNRICESGYYIIGCNSLVRYYLIKCVQCLKLRGKTQVQQMADLPEDRYKCEAPFTYSAVDYFGPFSIRQKRSIVQRYGVLFTCLSSRAVHLETAPLLDTDSFINALRRFIAIRGPVRILRSDRGTNFVGAKNEFAHELENMTNDTVRKFLLENGADLEFKMNFPHSSHMGGVWERQIRTVRNVLMPMLQSCGEQLDDDALRTLFYEAMAIVNSRPLTVDNLSDATSANPLSPNHLLTQKTRVVLPPPGEFVKEDIYSRKRWRRVQYLLNVFWSRFKVEYLQTLQARQKWNGVQRNVQLGDVVILKDDDIRNNWQLAIVEEAFPSADGQVRKVKLRIADKSLNKDGQRVKNVSYLERPIHKLVVLVQADQRNSTVEEPYTT